MNITITITDLPKGYCRVELENGQTLFERTDTPFYGSARKLLSLGLAKPTDVLLMRRTGRASVDMSGTVGEAAKWAISEGSKEGLRRVRYQDSTRLKDWYAASSDGMPIAAVAS